MNKHTSIQETSSISRHEEYVCWSKMQAEAGQQLEAIVARKEFERRSGDGHFFWGVGNAPALITGVLSRAHVPVRVVFSIMKSRPKAMDVKPTKVFVWRRYTDQTGLEKLLPPHALVTSRASSLGGMKKNHYALMCYSSEALVLKFGAKNFDPSMYRNAGGNGGEVGFSQVTAMLRRTTASETLTKGYEENMTAWLEGGYWVRLSDPVELKPQKYSLLESLRDPSNEKWCGIVEKLRAGSRSRIDSPKGDLLI